MYNRAKKFDGSINNTVVYRTYKELRHYLSMCFLRSLEQKYLWLFRLNEIYEEMSRDDL